MGQTPNSKFHKGTRVTCKRRGDRSWSPAGYRRNHDVFFEPGDLGVVAAVGVGSISIDFYKFEESWRCDLRYDNVQLVSLISAVRRWLFKPTISSYYNVSAWVSQPFLFSQAYSQFYFVIRTYPSSSAGLYAASLHAVSPQFAEITSERVAIATGWDPHEFASLPVDAQCDFYVICQVSAPLWASVHAQHQALLALAKREVRRFGNGAFHPVMDGMCDSSGRNGWSATQGHLFTPPMLRAPAATVQESLPLFGRRRRRIFALPDPTEEI